MILNCSVVLNIAYPKYVADGICLCFIKGWTFGKLICNGSSEVLSPPQYTKVVQSCDVTCNIAMVMYVGGGL